MTSLIASAFWMIFGTTLVYGESQNNQSQPSRYTDDLKKVDNLLKKYDRRMLPTFNQDTPTIVTCEFFVNSISSVNPITMDYDVDLYLRQSWNDTRLHSVNLSRPLDVSDPKLVRSFWKPEVFFANAKHAAFQKVTVPNVMLRIYPNGTILYLLRLQLTFSCMMDLTKYPFDTQVCTMEMTSFSKTIRELVLEWTTSEPIRLVTSLKLSQYEITETRASLCSTYFHQGDYSCIMAELFLKRSIGYHLLESYLSTIIILVTSWLSFWLDVEAVPARTTLGIATLLTISVKGGDIQEKLPPASYIKAIDVWMSACIAFVFGAVLEFAFVNCKCRSGYKKTINHVSTDNVYNAQTQTDNLKGDYHVSSNAETGAFQKAYAGKFDNISKVAFPVGFLLFNIVYWPYYLYYT